MKGTRRVAVFLAVVALSTVTANSSSAAGVEPNTASPVSARTGSDIGAVSDGPVAREGKAPASSPDTTTSANTSSPLASQLPGVAASCDDIGEMDSVPYFVRTPELRCLFLSLFALQLFILAVLIERFGVYMRAGRGSSSLAVELQASLAGGDVARATASLGLHSNTSIARVAIPALEEISYLPTITAKSIARLDLVCQRSAQAEILKLRQGISALKTVAVTAGAFGLLAMIWGWARILEDARQAEGRGIAVLIAAPTTLWSIWFALATALAAYWGYRWFESKVRCLAGQMDDTALLIRHFYLSGGDRPAPVKLAPSYSAGMWIQQMKAATGPKSTQLQTQWTGAESSTPGRARSRKTRAKA
ncbi:MAG TPA: MotA/TolQ/ExbB proton channel family protein [Blastocatellia bacterium]|nr:MotA/TolQ/ExbB proton channel family protein [Blastocatellia bacterium]